ncbi:hypothetical protein SISSUDRAFT_1051499 [Sistotremastrum suecicum HHB10207 ss-3]|uniref:Zygote-specific protein n=1 Tax=Sistotremastrum suecicum HHB10207 ss-3 TaxID=1314776 RepID=A0A166AJT9_9AGAM|nr:hypothetical protein SISSUDRAFT_1051499 [Sistotremastrum suecicum HHB10207 ss-3]
MRLPFIALVALVPAMTGSGVAAGPLAYAACQAGCASLVMACYSAAGFVWGATLGVAAPPTIIACNVGYGTCQAACAGAALVAPTP